ncbi:hypothetical protein EUAN_02280 [Andreesenia angusta]|uniref:Copper amine oxidase-like N-terminal domain-containing protein n=1 Tax=Andreesenia angusta TaxID=39480 RepID=A0A1S1VA39_9FIRM|nr:stalk domain-containing protein [Andreesenia angusta]OHW63364.1 hypothetical protein EUAN_02280 [Andreesenia angusta]
MKKLRVSILLSLFSLFLVSSFASAEQSIKITFNGAEVRSDVPPVVMNGRTIVPVRAIFEKFGIEPIWNQKDKTVTAQRGDISIKLTLNSDIAEVNGEPKLLDQSVAAVNGRTLVPVRFVSETFGAGVEWNQSVKAVLIKTEEKYGNVVEMPFSDIFHRKFPFVGSYFVQGSILYDGEAKNGIADGSGTLYYSQSSSNHILYIGDFKENMMHGNGTLYYPGGVMAYTGGLQNDKLHGNGKLYFADKSLAYSGDFQNDNFHGFGIQYGNSNSIVYKGSFSQGLRHGQGILYDCKGRVLHNGVFVNGEPKK